MGELLAHLFGDYILQNDWMALGKYKSKPIALLHGLIYSIPFIFLIRSWTALLIIGLSHSVIDHWKLACFIDRLKNWNFKTPCGFSEDRPIWLVVWLGIITDNTIHLLINHLALKIFR